MFLLPNTHRTKLQPVTTRCAFIGYSINHKGYRCKDLLNGKITISRHVVFDKKTLPFKENVCTADRDKETTPHFWLLTTALLPTPSELCNTVSENNSKHSKDLRQSSLTDASTIRHDCDQIMATAEDSHRRTQESNDRVTIQRLQEPVTDRINMDQGRGTRRSSRTCHRPFWMTDYDLLENKAEPRQNLSATVTSPPNSNIIGSIGS